MTMVFEGIQITRNTKKSYSNRASECKRLRGVKQHIAFGITSGTKNRPVAEKMEALEVKSTSDALLWSLNLYPMGKAEPLKVKFQGEGSNRITSVF